MGSQGQALVLGGGGQGAVGLLQGQVLVLGGGGQGVGGLLQGQVLVLAVGQGVGGLLQGQRLARVCELLQQQLPEGVELGGQAVKMVIVVVVVVVVQELVAVGVMEEAVGPPTCVR
jgi:hypothetical protein